MTSLHRFYSSRMLPCVSLLLFLLLARVNSFYHSYIILSSFGMEFQPRMSIQLLSMTTCQSTTQCAVACNQFQPCRTFNYDSSSKQCRLFEGDLTTGFTVLSSVATSIVGTVLVSASLYTSAHTHPCFMWEESRYEICSLTTSRYQCPAHSFWNGLICALQLFENDTCTQIDACRSDLNLTCSANMYGEFQTCAQSSSHGTCNILSLMNGSF